VFPPEADGLAGWLYRLGPGGACRDRVPGGACTLPEPSADGGQYLVVAGGAMVADGVELPRNSIAYVSPDEAVFQVVAGQAGLDLLVLQFPMLAPQSATAVA